MAVYKNLLMGQDIEYRADACYLDLWALADDIIGSFNVLGRGDITQLIAFGIYALRIAGITFITAKNCIPLFLENPSTFTPMEKLEGW